jgi:hypothetical protein
MKFEYESLFYIAASNMTTTNPNKPAPNNPVLYVDDYNIHNGYHVYRASFHSTTAPPTGVYIAITGGLAFGYSAWLNGQFVGSYFGRSWITKDSIEFSFSNATLNNNTENVLVILMDNSGHDQRSEAILPRGITNATLTGPGAYSFTEWKIAGTAGRNRIIDPLRGPLNEGGLWAERVGAHLPGFPNDDWEKVLSNATSLIVKGAGVQVFRTVVPLNVPSGVDVSVNFRLTAPSESTFTSQMGLTNQLRALLFVNGYQYGRFNPYIGHQIDFPIPPGILNYNGNNTIAVTIWSQASEGVEMKISWNTVFVHQSSYDFNFDSTYLHPGWAEDRMKYA